MSLRLSTNAITEITGTYSFTFAFEAHLNESDLVTSLEVSTAETSVPLIIKWFRIKEEKIFPVPEIASK